MGKQTNNQITVISNYLTTKVDKISDLLPPNAGITAQRLVRVALMAINDQPALLRCTRESIYAALLESARLGLEIGGAVPQGYLVPYGNKATFLIGYRGLIELVMRSGSCKDINVEFVYEGDSFHRELGINGKWTHIATNDPNREARTITHVYAEFLLPDDRVKRYTMTKAEIDSHAEQYSQAYTTKDSPWKTNWKAMAAKTVIRQPILRGLLPIRLPEVEKKAVLFDPQPQMSVDDFAHTFASQLDGFEQCGADGELPMTDEEKAKIEAAEREA